MLLLLTRNILNEVNVLLENVIAQNLPWSLIYPVHPMANWKRYNHQKDLSKEDELNTMLNFVVDFFRTAQKFF